MQLIKSKRSNWSKNSTIKIKLKRLEAIEIDKFYNFINKSN